MITVFLIISILLSLALWVEPPNITVSNPVQNSTQSFTFQNNQLAFNLAANITVENPNYFGVALNKVELDPIPRRRRRTATHQHQIKRPDQLHLPLLVKL